MNLRSKLFSRTLALSPGIPIRPIRGFKVGAALRLTTGEVVTGTNVENVSYGLTLCAERSALVRAVSEFGPGIRIAAIAVANLNDAASPPCGACRQMLAEFVLARCAGGLSLPRMEPAPCRSPNSAARVRYEAEVRMTAM